MYASRRYACFAIILSEKYGVKLQRVAYFTDIKIQQIGF